MLPRATLVPAVVVAALAACAAPKPESPVAQEVDRSTRAQQIIATWSDPAAEAARGLIGRYGTPDVVEDGRLAWGAKGPWARVEVSDETPPYDAREVAAIQESVSCKLDDTQEGRLRQFSPALAYDADHGLLSSRESREELNLLNMNLASQIARGAMTPEQARGEREYALSLEASGKTSPYMGQALFSPGSL